MCGLYRRYEFFDKFLRINDIRSANGFQSPFFGGSTSSMPYTLSIRSNLNISRD